MNDDERSPDEVAQVRLDLRRAATPMLEYVKLHAATIQFIAQQGEQLRTVLRDSAPLWTQQMTAMRQTAESVGALGTQLQDLARILKAVDIESQWQQLAPAFRTISRVFDDSAGLRSAISAWTIKLRQADLVLTKHGFGWTSESLPPHFVASFAAVSGPSQGAAVTNMMRAQTARPAFRDYLEERIGGSTLLAPRWKVLGPALDAHIARNYVLSIPALTAQAEGILTQLLVMQRLVRRKGRKLIALDPATKQVRRNRNGDPVQLRGLQDKVKQSDLNSHPILRTLVNVLLDSFIGDRNGVMHGSTTTYGTAKRSTQAVLMVAVLAEQVCAIESPRSKKAAA